MEVQIFTELYNESDKIVESSKLKTFIYVHFLRFGVIPVYFLRTRLSTLVIVRARALMVTQDPSVSFTCEVKLALWSAPQLSHKKIACGQITPIILKDVVYSEFELSNSDC